MKQQTAVKYLIEQLFPKALSEEQYYHIEKAKEMEKEQIVNSWDLSRRDIDYLANGEQYYNETFKNK